jgi:hypothetical protein
MSYLSKLGWKSFALSGAMPTPQGYNAANDLITTTADGFDLNNIWNEFQAAVSLINAQRDVFIDLLTFPVTELIERVPQIQYANFEKASEYGEPRGIRPAGAFFNLGYDFDWYDIGARFTWKFLADAPASQIEAINAQVLEADNNLMFQGVMKAIFNNVNRVADINGQAVNVYPLYNADGTVPPPYKTNTFTGSETHYITSGNATVQHDDLTDMYEKLRAKGYSQENGVKHVLFVNRQQGNTIRTFRVASGATYDFIPAIGTPASYLPIDVVLFGGSQPQNTYAGLSAIGSYGPWLIVEDDFIPVGYMLGIGSGGRANLRNLVGLREHQNTQLRGLRLVKGAVPDYPLIDSFYQRGFGTGVRQRGGGVVMQVTASGTYTIPTIYQ